MGTVWLFYINCGTGFLCWTKLIWYHENWNCFSPGQIVIALWNDVTAIVLKTSFNYLQTKILPNWLDLLCNRALIMKGPIYLQINFFGKNDFSQLKFHFIVNLICNLPPFLYFYNNEFSYISFNLFNIFNMHQMCKECISTSCPTSFQMASI